MNFLNFRETMCDDDKYPTKEEYLNSKKVLRGQIAMEQGLSKDAAYNIWSAFITFDRSNEGFLDLEDCRLALMLLQGRCLTRQDYELMCPDIDADEEGVVVFEEFAKIATFTSTDDKEDQIKDLFHIFASTAPKGKYNRKAKLEDKVIDIEGFKYLLQFLKVKTENDTLIESSFQKADVYGRSELGYNEFKDFYDKHNLDINKEGLLPVTEEAPEDNNEDDQKAEVKPRTGCNCVVCW